MAFRSIRRFAARVTILCAGSTLLGFGMLETWWHMFMEMDPQNTMPVWPYLVTALAGWAAVLAACVPWRWPSFGDVVEDLWTTSDRVV